MEQDERPAARAVLVRLGGDRGRVQDERVGLEALELLVRGSMKSVFAKSVCHGLSEMTRTASLCAGSAPANASIT